MNESNDKYLLNDDEFARLMEAQFKEAGEPVDDVRARKQWTQIQNKIGQSRSKRNGLIWGSILGVAAALFLLVRLQNFEPSQPTFRGEGPSDYRLRWVNKNGQERDVIGVNEIAQHHLRVSFEKSLKLAVYGTAANAKDIRELSAVFDSAGTGQKDLDIPVEVLNGIERICVLGAANDEEFGRARALLEGLWAMLGTEQCVGIHFGS